MSRKDDLLAELAYYAPDAVVETVTKYDRPTIEVRFTLDGVPKVKSVTLIPNDPMTPDEAAVWLLSRAIDEASK